MKKNAYLQGERGTYIDSPRNIQKWMQAMRDIYSDPVIGWDDAFGKVTSGWDDMEKKEFKKWMDFYQENAHQKYKSAQFVPSHIENGGGFIPNVDHLRSNLSGRAPDMSGFVAHQNVDDVREKQLQKDLVDRKIQSLISRLNAAEKIATNPQVQVALRKCLEMSVGEWVSLLQKLKREIQLAPMRVSSSHLMEDIIYKNANQVNASGNHSAALALLKVAQMPMTPATTPMGGQPMAPVEDDDSAIEEFLKNLDGDENQSDDDVAKVEDEDDLAEITVTAQAAPPMAPPPPAGNPSPDLVVSEEDIAPPSPSPTPSEMTTGDPFDRALSNVKISDIVTRLEGIASMFKNRQIARQLSIIDLMMDKTGIAPFFPTLAEAMRSALESNQYCQSRVEEILAKLRGTMVTPMSTHMENEVSGGEESVKTQLAEQEMADKARKERRKQIQEQEEKAKLAPQPPPAGVANAPEELAGPAQVQTAPPLRPPAG